jgi:hypothetical protein
LNVESILIFHYIIQPLYVFQGFLLLFFCIHDFPFYFMYNQVKANDVDQDAWVCLRKTRADASVKTPRKMVTRSQTQAAIEEVSTSAKT